jgi:hypothetical protein
MPTLAPPAWAFFVLASSPRDAGTRLCAPGGLGTLTLRALRAASPIVGSLVLRPVTGLMFNGPE